MKEYHRRYGYFLVDLFKAGDEDAEKDEGPATVMKKARGRF